MGNGKTKLILSATELPDGWFNVELAFEDGSIYGNHFSSTLQYAKHDGESIVKRFLESQIDKDDFEIINNIKTN